MVKNEKKLGWFKSYAASIILIGLVIGSCLIILAKRQDDFRTLRWAHVYETSSPYHSEALWAAEQFSERTDGRYQIKVFPASSLGNEVSINEGLGLGSIDLIYTGASLAGQYYGPLSLSDYPYAIRSLEHWEAYRDSGLFSELSEGYNTATGNKIMGLVYYGFRHVIANKPIYEPADMKNLKIRVPQARPFLMMPEETGANATPMPFQEVYLGLQQGVIEAAENPLTTIYYKRFYEVQSHISLTGHIANSLVIVSSGNLVNSMPASDQAILQQVIDEASERAFETIKTQEFDLIDWYNNNGTLVVEADRDAFAAAVLPALKGKGMPFTAEHLARLTALTPEAGP